MWMIVGDALVSWYIMLIAVQFLFLCSTLLLRSICLACLLLSASCGTFVGVREPDVGLCLEQAGEPFR